MNEVIYSLIRLIVVAAVLLITRYAIPYLKNSIEAQKLDAICGWATKAVRCAEQVLTDASGPEKKAIVTEFLHQVLTAKHITLTEKELDTIIEAAVNVMNETAASTDAQKEDKTE